MFGKDYYCLVAGFRDYALDSEAKGFDAKAIIEECFEELSAVDAQAVRMLYTYYDCENIVSHRAGRTMHNALGLISRELLEESSSFEELLPKSIAEAILEYDKCDSTEPSTSFEKMLFGAYYAECAASSSSFLRSWSKLDRDIRNISAALIARSAGMELESVVVGGGDVVAQILKSSAVDFGLRTEFSWLDSLVAAVNEESNLVEKERKIDLLRWDESTELLNFDYFNINAVLSYLVKINIVARWSALDAKLGREMFERIVSELGAKDMIDNNN